MADSAPLLTQSQLPDIIQRYVNGESLSTLAHEAKKNRSTIYRWMLSGCGDAQFGDVVTECLINRVAESDELLDNAPDSCNIARAREVAKFARMDLERRRPQLYGPKQEVKQDTTITVIIQKLTQAELQAPVCLDQVQAPTDQTALPINDLSSRVR